MKRVRHRNAGVRQRRATRPAPTATYSVGYGQPPRNHQFQPGQSGNRKGRPKGAKNTLTLLREILDRRIEMRSGGILRRVSVREAMLTRFAESALKGDIKSAAFLLQRYDMSDTVNEHATDTATQDEQDIINAFLEDYAQNRGDRK
jgi:hypothetical protein